MYRHTKKGVYNIDLRVSVQANWYLTTPLSFSFFKYLLGGFQKIFNKAAGNQHLRFTSEIWTNGSNIPPSDKKYNFQTCAAERFHFLDMKMIWSPEGAPQVGIFKKKVHQLK